MKTCVMRAVRTRRRLLMSAVVVAAAVANGGVPGTASAQPPAQQATQAPGYFRMMLGKLEVTSLYDGQIALSPAILQGASANELEHLLARRFVPQSDSGVQTAINAFLVNTGSNLVLVDAGAAECFGPGMGQVVANIRAAGYEPEQVDTILLTHLHGDHVCGVATAQGEQAFPNATVYVSQDEADYWLDTGIAAQAPAEAQPFFKAAQGAVAPYVAADKLKKFKAGDTLVQGVVSVPLLGHTPGHGGYMFSSAEHRLLVWGDIVHSHAVQFSRPEVSIEFDSDPARAIATRKDIFARADAQKFWVAGAHLPFPGIGHVGASEQAYTWIPAEYGPIKAE